MANASNSNEVYYDEEMGVWIDSEGDWYTDEECTEPAGSE